MNWWPRPAKPTTLSLPGSPTFAAVRRSWGERGQAATALREALLGLPMKAFLWETPPVDEDNLDAVAFEFTALPEPALDRPADGGSFVGHFGDAATATFDSLRGDSTLVAPTPRPGEDAAHLGSFVHTAGESRWLDLMQAVAAADERVRPAGRRWLSTSGLGVPWLHVRLDPRPKYYRHGPYRV